MDVYYAVVFLDCDFCIAHHEAKKRIRTLIQIEKGRTATLPFSPPFTHEIQHVDRICGGHSKDELHKLILGE